MLTGLGEVRLTSSKRLVGRPLDMAWFCRGHSPPLSHTGQSSGWLISRNSIWPCWALSATGEVNCDLTCMPSLTAMVQEACGLGMGRSEPSGPRVATSTMHWRQAPTGSSSGWSQNRGICTPICSAARITKVPLGTLTASPSMVRLTMVVAVEEVTVMRARSPSRKASRQPAGTAPRRGVWAGSELLTEADRHDGRRAHLHHAGGQGHGVGADPVEFHHQHADGGGPLGDLVGDAGQLLDGQAVGGLVEERREVVHAGAERHALGPVTELHVFLDTAAQIADVGVGPGLGDGFAVELEDEAQDAVGRGVLPVSYTHLTLPTNREV